jgi:hypothetical protein
MKIYRIIPAFALLITSLIAPLIASGQVTMIDASGNVCANGCEQIRYTIPYSWPNGMYPRVITGYPYYDNYPTSPLFDGAIAPISFPSDSMTKFRFNVSFGYRNYQLLSTMTGSGSTADFTTPVLSTASVYNATLARNNDAFAWAEWLYGTFRDATTNPSAPKVYAAMYNEYYGGSYNVFFGSSNTYSAMGIAVSTNNGTTFSKITTAPFHIFARMPYLYPDGGGCSMFGGIFKSPLDQLYYSIINDGVSGAALFRTGDLNDPGSWRGLSTSGAFTVSGLPLTSYSFKNINVYPLYLGWSDYFKKFMVVGIGNVTGDYGSVGNNQIVYNLSDDMINWGLVRRIMYNPACGADHACGNDVAGEIGSYPSIMDAGYLADTANSTKTSNGMTGSRPLITYIKQIHSSGQNIDQQFATQRVNFEGVIFNRMDNFSTRGVVDSGDRSLVMGFIMQGAEPKKFVFRGIGPSLPNFSYPRIGNPRISLYDGAGNLLAVNAGWKSLSGDDQTFLISQGLNPSNDAESAIVATLPGSAGYTFYTVKMDNGYGMGVIESYDMSSTAETRIAEVSVRGYSQPGDGAITMGFISRGGQQAVVRGTGVSTLAPAGFSPVIANPVVVAYDSSANQIASNDNWNTPASNGSIVQGYGLAPGDSLESATIFSTTTPAFSATAPNSVYSIYGVQLQGTGFGLLELYNVNSY